MSTPIIFQSVPPSIHRPYITVQLQSALQTKQ